MKKLLIAGILVVPLLGADLMIDSGGPGDQFFVGGAGDFTISYPGASGDLSVRYGAFSYHIPEPPGVFLVTLNFRETGTVSAKNQRIFSVKLGGQLVIDRLDLFATAGLASIERNYVAASNNGFIDIEFSLQLKSAVVSSIRVQTLFGDSGLGASSWQSCKSGVVVVGGTGLPWSCDGLLSFVGTDGIYVAVKMPEEFVRDPRIWKQLDWGERIKP